jgi:hypothetical protein
MLGLCNFNTDHMQRVIDSGITVYSNQVQVITFLFWSSSFYLYGKTNMLKPKQFSLIDSRPMVKMGEVCIKHNVKLLTYGTLVCSEFYLQILTFFKFHILTLDSVVVF